MTKEKGFYKNFFHIYVALVLQNVITLSVNLADNMMLGAYRESALAGVAAVNQIQFVYQQLLMALGDGMVIFCSQYWGRKQTEPMKKIAAIAMQLALLIAVLLFSLVSLFPKQAVGLFTTDAAIISEGVRYIGIIRFSYLAELESEIPVCKINFRFSISLARLNSGKLKLLYFSGS